MFTKTAEYYDALYHFKDYEEACLKLHQMIQSNIEDAKTLLDVGCGTGKHVEYLQKFYDTDGLDINEELLKVARSRCPNTSFFHGDMTNFDLNKQYDIVVCLFSSIAYVQSKQNLDKSIMCMAAHLKPGGLLVVEPWLYPENYWLGRITANYVDQNNLKIAWMYVSELIENTSVFNIHYMVGTPDGIENFQEKHIMGLWNDSQYRSAFEKAGILNVQYDAEGFFGRGVYYGRTVD